MSASEAFADGWEALMATEGADGVDDSCGCCSISATLPDPVNPLQKYWFSSRKKCGYCRSVHFLKFYDMSWGDFCDACRGQEGLKTAIHSLRTKLIACMRSGEISLKSPPLPKQCVWVIKTSVKVIEPDLKVEWLTHDAFVKRFKKEPQAEGLKPVTLQLGSKHSEECYKVVSGEPGVYVAREYQEEKTVHQTMLDDGTVNLEPRQQIETWDRRVANILQERAKELAELKSAEDLLRVVEAPVLLAGTPARSQKADSLLDDSDDERRVTVLGQTPSTGEPPLKQARKSGASALEEEYDNLVQRLEAACVQIPSMSNDDDLSQKSLSLLERSMTKKMEAFRKEGLIAKAAEATSWAKTAAHLKIVMKALADYCIEDPKRRHMAKFIEAVQGCSQYDVIKKNLGSAILSAYNTATIKKALDDGQDKQAVALLSPENLLPAAEGETGEVADENFVKNGEIVLDAFIGKAVSLKRKDSPSASRWKKSEDHLNEVLPLLAEVKAPEASASAIAAIVALVSLRPPAGEVTLEQTLAKIEGSKGEPFIRVLWTYEQLTSGLVARARKADESLQRAASVVSRKHAAEEFCERLRKPLPADGQTDSQDIKMLVAQHCSHMLESLALHSGDVTHTEALQHSSAHLVNSVQAYTHSVMKHAGLQITRVLDDCDDDDVLASAKVFLDAPLLEDGYAMLHEVSFKKLAAMVPVDVSGISSCLQFGLELRNTLEGCTRIMTLCGAGTMSDMAAGLMQFLLDACAKDGYAPILAILSQYVKAFVDLAARLNDGTNFQACVGPYGLSEASVQAYVAALKENINDPLLKFYAHVKPAYLKTLVGESTVSVEAFGVDAAVSMFLPQQLFPNAATEQIAGHARDEQRDAVMLALATLEGETAFKALSLQVGLSGAQIAMAACVLSFHSNVLVKSAGDADSWAAGKQLRFALGMSDMALALLQSVSGLRAHVENPTPAALRAKLSSAEDCVKNFFTKTYMQAVLDTMHAMLNRSAEEVPTGYDQHIINQNVSAIRTHVLKREIHTRASEVLEVVESAKTQLTSIIAQFSKVSLDLPADVMANYARLDPAIKKIQTFVVCVNGLVQMLGEWTTKSVQSRAASLREYQASCKRGGIQSARPVVALLAWMEKSKTM